MPNAPKTKEAQDKCEGRWKHGAVLSGMMGKGVDWVKGPARDAPITPRLRSPASRSAALLRRCPAASGAERHYAGLAQISHFFSFPPFLCSSSTPTAQNLPLPPLTNRRLPFFYQSGATIRSPAEREAASALNAAAFHNNGIKGGGGGGGGRGGGGVGVCCRGRN